MKIRQPTLDVAFDLRPRTRWGRLQSRVLYALLDGSGEASGDEIARYCWDGRPTERQMYSQRRAAKSIGARPMRRIGRKWVWQLDCN